MITSLTLKSTARAEQVTRQATEVNQRDSLCFDRRTQAIQELRDEFDVPE